MEKSDRRVSSEALKSGQIAKSDVKYGDNFIVSHGCTHLSEELVVRKNEFHPQSLLRGRKILHNLLDDVRVVAGNL